MNEKDQEFPVPKEEPDKMALEQFKEAVMNGDAGTADQLLRHHASLASQINEPWFAFDTPAIVAAASRGDREMVDVLLENGADINAKSSWWAGGFGVLHHDCVELSQYLIDRGAHVDPHAAAALGMLDALKQMVAEDASVVNQRGPDGQAPLHFALSREIIDFLLTNGADIDMRDIDHGSTPAQWSVDHPEKCKYLIERGAKTDIFMACMLGDTDLVRGILEADPNCLHAQVGEGSYTSGKSDGGHIYEYKIGVAVRPLFLAARLNHQDIKDLMLEYSSIEMKFLLACLQADTAAVHAIVAERPNIVKSLQPKDQSLIADAAWDNQTDAVRTMLEVGFDVDARRSPQSSTALHQAAKRGNLEIVELLLAHGASVHQINEYGGTVLNSCIWGSMYMQDAAADYPAVAESLIRAGVKLPDRAAGSDAVKEIMIKHGVA